MEKELQSLGLSWNEIKVYRSLLKLGETAVGGIIHDLKVHRQIAYNALTELEKRGMVEKAMKNSVAHWKIADPQVIVENIQKQEIIAKRLALSIRRDMKKDRHEQEIKIYSGQSGARKFYLQAFKNCPVGAECYVMGVSVSGHMEALGKDFILGEYKKIRDKRKIYSSLVMGESERIEEEEYHKSTNPELRETRFLPYENKNPISTTIWPDRVSFMATGKEVFTVEIINTEFRNSMKAHFDLLWKMAKNGI